MTARWRLALAVVALAGLVAGCRDEGRQASTFPQLPADPPAVTGVVYGSSDGRSAVRYSLPDLNGTVIAGDANTEQAALAALPGDRTVAVGRERRSVEIRDATGGALVTVRLDNEVISSATGLTGGGYALLVQRPGGGTTNRASLVTFSPTGVPVHEAAIGDVTAVSTRASEIVLTTSTTGLVAVFPDSLERNSQTSVYNAATGALVRSFAARSGGAWSPDGTGLVLGAVNSSGSTDVWLVYGPKLARSERLGTTGGRLVPMRWLPEALPGA